MFSLGIRPYYEIRVTYDRRYKLLQKRATFLQYVDNAEYAFTKTYYHKKVWHEEEYRYPSDPTLQTEAIGIHW